MLDLTAVDLDALAEALEDHSDTLRWFVDPATGEVLVWSADADDEPSPEETGALFVEPIFSHEAYRDMQDFVGQLSDRRAVGLLTRALEGRGAFRRFKDTLFEFPDLRSVWFAFHDVRMRRRAIDWLLDAGLVAEGSARSALEGLEDPVIGRGLADPDQAAQEVASRLRGVFGDRLVDVVVFGSYAAGTASEDSDLDLAVVLSGVRSSWEDARAMDDILWAATQSSGITFSAVVVDAQDWAAPHRPVLLTAKAQGRSVA
jgi:hypothetical protein